MATLKERISEDMKAAMKSGDKDRLSAIRMLHAAVRKKEIDDRVNLDDAGIIKVIGSLAKQRQDSIEQFKAGGRQDLVDKESAELKLLQGYLPAQFSEAELLKIVESTIAETDAKTPKDMGAVMKALLPKIAGKADGKLASQLVSKRLSGA